jgi:predicted permease
VHRLRELLFRLRWFFRKKTGEATMTEEIRMHLEMATAANRAAGLSPEEARYAARREFGGVDQVKEAWRDERTVVWLEQSLRDVRFAARSLARHPTISLAAVLTLAIGLTVNATLFSFVNELFLRPLPATDPGRLVVMALKIPKFQYALPNSYPDFQDFRQQVEGTGREAPELAKAFAGLMAYKEEVVHLSRSGEGTERAWIHLVSDNYFSVLGVIPYRGRLILPTEGKKPGADPIIVLTHAAWRDRFGSDLRIVGQQIKLNGLPFTVVGVTPPDFVGAAWGTALSGFVPVTMHPQLAPASGGWMIFERGSTGCFMVGRLQAGATLAQAHTAGNLMMARLFKEYPKVHQPGELLVFPENRSRPSPYVASYMPLIVTALMTLAGLVLAVAAANVANLLYARAADRERDLAVRGALGASRGRLLRQLLSESVLLALAAGTVGTVVALVVQPYLNRMVSPSDFAPAADTGVDWRIIVFTLGASLAAGLLTGLLPALKATRLDILPLIKAGVPTLNRARHPWRSLLVVGQIAISCVVLVCAGLAVRSLRQLSHVQLGFRPDQLLIASLDLDRQRYTPEKGAKFQANLRDRVQALPGVRSVSFAEHAPFDTTMSMKGDISAEGAPVKDNTQFEFTPCQAVDQHYVETSGMTLAEGRDFSDRDTAASPPVVIISAALARNLWPNASAVGKRLLMNQRQPPSEVVGVLGEGRFWNLTTAAQRFLFLPMTQEYHGSVRLLVRTEGDPSRLASTVEQIVREIDPDLPLFGVRTMVDQMAASPNALMPLRVGTLIAGAQGAIALLLAGLGIFGLIAFTVTRRTREIGIRMALGASVGEVIRLVTRDGLRLVAIGLGLGLLLSLGITRVLTSLLYGVSPTDATVFLAVPTLVLAIALVACWLPARRAAKVDPAMTLRAE